MLTQVQLESFTADVITMFGSTDNDDVSFCIS